MLEVTNGKNIVFSAEPKKKGSNSAYQHDTILKNNVSTNLKIAADKFENSITIYPARGLKGSKNSNFYEFLTTGTFPYIAGSLTLMSVFNYTSKFDNFGKGKADAIGRKMALGVLFYGLAKTASKALVNKPVKWATGVDLDLPYAKVVYNEPTSKNDTDITRTEYHKVFESVEFPRWDLLYKDETKGEARNAYFDHIAEKMGLGTNLKDSDQEVKPKIKQVVTRATTVSRITQYLWAGLGVGIAMQKPWENFLKNTSFKSYKTYANGDKAKKLKLTENLLKNTIKSFWFTFKKSAKEFYSPTDATSRFQKHAGKAFLFSTIAATVLGDFMACHISKKATKVDAGKKVIDKSRKYTVN